MGISEAVRLSSAEKRIKKKRSANNQAVANTRRMNYEFDSAPKYSSNNRRINWKNKIANKDQ